MRIEEYIIQANFIKINGRTDSRLFKKGTPWDNACIESFHSVIKREWLNRTLIYDYDHAYDLCFEYIETFYNTIRIHSHCGYESPNQYENNYYSKH
ncbi:MAG: integrase core domain-containing protein [Holdemanella porci]